MFSDPQSVTINAVPISLPRVSTGANTATYQSADGNVRFTVSHQYGKRNRRLVRIDHQKVAADPLAADRNLRYSMACHVVIDTPPVGYSATEAKQVVDGLLAYLTATSGAQVAKVLGGES